MINKDVFKRLLATFLMGTSFLTSTSAISVLAMPGNKQSKSLEGEEQDDSSTDSETTSEQTASEKQKETELTQNDENKKLDAHAMMIVSKYFDSVKDYINLEKTNKEYNGIIDKFHFNPIPLKNKKERKIFKNVETYHHYEDEAVTSYKPEKDKRNKKHIYWEIDYKTFENKKDASEIKENEEYKNVVLRQGILDNGFGRYGPIVYIVPEGVTKIGKGCFKYYEPLPTANLLISKMPSTLREIDDEAFFESRFQNIEIPEGVTRIGKNCFANCFSRKMGPFYHDHKCLAENFLEIPQLRLPSTLKEIGDRAFANSSLCGVKIPEGISRISKDCFKNCPYLIIVTIPSNIKEIDDRAFLGCRKIKSIEIPEGVTRIGKLCFSGCFFIPKGQYSYMPFDLLLPTTLKEIDDGAFSDCYNISSVEMLEGVTKIGKKCFNGCYRLKSVILPSTLEEIGTDAFLNCNNLKTIIAPANVINILKSSNVILPEDVELIEN